MTFAQSAAEVARIRAHFTRHGYGPWAVEVAGGAPFIGFIGLWIPEFDAPFTPCVELGYRLAFEHWGKGYATEGARAVLAYGFDTLGLKEIVAMTATQNVRSQRVMEKLGMSRRPADDFDHPKVAAGHPLRRHVLYRLRKIDARA
jgi:ribosomal-protein-alanine N-acetyltransferase